MPPCLTLSIIRYGSRVKLGNPGKGVAPSLPTSWCSSYQKGSLRVTLDYSHQLYFFILYFKAYNPSFSATPLILHIVMSHSTKQDFILGGHIQVQNSIQSLIRVLCIVKTFAFLEMKFLTIQPIIQFTRNTID